MVLLGLNMARYWVAVRRARAEGEHTFNTPPKRILIVHGSVGAGHKRAAQALSEALAMRHPEIKVEEGGGGGGGGG